MFTTEMVLSERSGRIRAFCTFRYIDMMAVNSTQQVTLARWTWLDKALEREREEAYCALLTSGASTSRGRQADLAMVTTYTPFKRSSCLLRTSSTLTS